MQLSSQSFVSDDKEAVKAAIPGVLARGAQFDWVVIAVVALAAVWMQLHVFLNHDVAWVLWGAREMVDGATWGRDIIEPNPPLAWYLAMPAALVANVFETPIAATFKLMVTGAALTSIAAFNRLTRSARLAEGTRSYLPSVMAALFLLLLPYRDFGQREHLMLIAALPYLGLVASRCTDQIATPRAIAITVGVAAGLGFALKPHFLAVPFMVEIAVMLALRRWTAAFRPETVAAGAVVVSYGAWVLVFVPEYLATVVPLAQAIYWSFDLPLSRVLGPVLLPVIAMVTAAGLLWRSPRSSPLIFFAATVGFLLSYLTQHKAYSYHLLPVTAGAGLTLATLLSDSIMPRKRRILVAMLLSLVLAQSLVKTAGWYSTSRPGGALATTQNVLIEAINREAEGRTFLVVAVHPFPAFPTALYTQARQVSRTNSHWFLPAIVQLRGGDVLPAPATLALAEQNARRFILHDLSHKPDLVVIDTDSARHTVGQRDFDFLSFYLEDEQFRTAWAPYREILPVEGFRLFVRSGGRGR
jgi:hypothetical protein